MTDGYTYKIKDLLKEFRKNGNTKSQMWVYRQEDKGNLIIARSTTDFKKPRGNRKIGAVRIFTALQIQQIVKSFSPEGSGFYDYRKSLQ